MDRKSIIILVVSFIFLMAWYPLVVNKLYPPKPLPRGTNAVASVVSTNTTGTTNLSVAPPPSLEAARSDTVPFVVPAGIEEQLLELTNSVAHYTFTSHGGGLKDVELLEYPESVSRAAKKQQTALRRVATLNGFTPAPTLAILGTEAVQGDGVYQLTRTATGVRAEKTLTNGLTIVKEFQLSTNYLLIANVRMENKSDAPLALAQQDWIVGTATPLGAKDQVGTVGVVWCNGAKTEEIGSSFFSSSGFMCMPKVPPAEYRGGASNVAWAAVHNQFFTLAAMPQQPANAVVVKKINLPRHAIVDLTQTTTANTPPPEGFFAALVYPSLILAPNQSVEHTIHLFAGPKEYKTLAKIGARFNNNIDLVMGYGGFFGFFAKGLLLAMNWLHDVIRLPYGWAIIAITVIIKGLFWPLTAASTRSMKRMAALQPQMKAIQEKYKDDAVKMNKKTMEFMKEHKVSPLGGCLPMLLQIPVFFGFYRMIQSAIELRGAPFFWVPDLSQPDTLFIIPGTGFPFNLLPLLMGVTMLWQARMTPPSPGMDPTQQKIMKYMPLMFMVFLYNFSAGLTLYWTVQNLLTILQTKLTRTVAEPALVPQKVAMAPGGGSAGFGKKKK
jgi:YidC/Oxa1 family membrane protein insertase